MSHLVNDMFWEDLQDKHWQEYEQDCKATGSRAKFKDFMVWAEEKMLVPEYDGDYHHE